MEPREISFIGHDMRRSRDNVEKWEQSGRLYSQCRDGQYRHIESVWSLILLTQTHKLNYSAIRLIEDKIRATLQMLQTVLGDSIECL